MLIGILVWLWPEQRSVQWTPTQPFRHPRVIFCSDTGSSSTNPTNGIWRAACVWPVNPETAEQNQKTNPKIVFSLRIQLFQSLLAARPPGLSHDCLGVGVGFLRRRSEISSREFSAVTFYDQRSLFTSQWRSDYCFILPVNSCLLGLSCLVKTYMCLCTLVHTFLQLFVLLCLPYLFSKGWCCLFYL